MATTNKNFKVKNGLEVAGEIGVGSTPSYGTIGQLLTSQGAGNAAAWVDQTSIATSTVKHQVKLGETISKGQAVYISTVTGANMIASKASNATEGTSSKTMGLLETGGVLNDQVNVITEGMLDNIDVGSASAGDPVWLGESGNLIYGLGNKPIAPKHLVFIGVVTKTGTAGRIFVRVQNGFELNEIHNVLIGTDYTANSIPANNEVLAFDSASNLWINQTAEEAGLANLSGATFTGNVAGTNISVTGNVNAATFSGNLAVTNITGLGANVARFLQNPGASNLATTLDGSGLTTGLTAGVGDLVFSQNPTFNATSPTAPFSVLSNVQVTNLTAQYVTNGVYTTTTSLPNVTSVNSTTIPNGATLLTTSNIGSSVQAYDADLTSIAGLANSAGYLYNNGTGTFSYNNSPLTSASTLDASKLNTNTVVTLNVTNVASTNVNTTTINANTATITAQAGTSGLTLNTASDTGQQLLINATGTQSTFPIAIKIGSTTYFQLSNYGTASFGGNSTDGRLNIQASAPANGVSIRGASGQVSPLLTSRTSGGTVLGGIGPNGGIFTGSTLGILGATTAVTAASASSTTVATFTIGTVSTVNPFAAGQVVTTAGFTSQTYFNGTFSVTSVGGSSGAWTIVVSGSGFTVGSATVMGTIGTAAQTSISPTSAGVIPLLVRTAANQQANIQEWQNSSGTALSYVDTSGTFFGNVNATTANATTFNGSGAGLTSIPNGATTAASANGASTIVARDASGDFSARTITANLTGSASNAAAVNVIANTTNATFYPTFIDSNNGTTAVENVYSGAGLTFNPSTNTLTTTNAAITTFTGNPNFSGAPTLTSSPLITDDSTKIATTAFVKNVIPYDTARTGYYELIYGTSSSNFSAVKDRMYLMAFKIEIRTTVTSLSINVTTGGGSTSVTRLGIYDWAGNLLKDAGTVATNTTGYKTATFTGIPLKPGLYFFAVASQVATTQPSYERYQTISPINPMTALGANNYAPYIESVTGAFSATLGTISGDANSYVRGYLGV